MLTKPTGLKSGYINAVLPRARIPNALLLLFLAALLFMPVMAQALVNLQITKLVDDNTVESGSTIVYRIQYTVASTTENAFNAIITDILPAELSSVATDIVLEGDGFVASTSYAQATRTARFVFQSPLNAGTTGTVLVRARFPLGTTINGTVSQNTATFTADNGTTATTPPVTVTAVASFRMTPLKDRTSGGALDFPTVYRLRLRNPSPNIGGLDLLNATMVDTLPAGVQFVSASNSGVYNSVDNTVTWALGDVPVGTSTDAVTRTVTVIFPSSVFASGQSVVNRMGFGGTPRGTSTSVSGWTSTTNSLTTGSSNMGFSKSNTSTSNLVPIGSSYLYRLNVTNSGYFELTNAYVEDTVPGRVAATSLQARGSGFFKTNLNSSWTPLSGNPYASLTTVQVSTLGLAAGEYVTSVRYEVGTLAVGFGGWSSSAQPGYTAAVLATDRSGNAVVAGQTIVNNAAAGANFSGGSLSRTATNTVTVYNGAARPRIEKYIIGATGLKPGQTATYELRLRNNLPATDMLINPIMADLLDANLTYVAGSWSVNASPAGTPAPNFEELANYNATGRTLLRWSWSGAAAYSLPPNLEIRIRFNAVLRAGIPPNTQISNTGYITGYDNVQVDLGSALQRPADGNDLDNDGNRTELIAASSGVVITVGQLATLESVKWVKGQLDSDWSRYPGTGLTVPGGTADYRLIVTNVGNVEAKDLVVIDILPFIGDGGVIDLSARDSQWRPNLMGEVSGPNGITVYYSTSGNPTRTEVVSNGPPGSEPANWTTDPPADITSVRSLKIDFGGYILQPQQSVELSWSMRAPVGAPSNGAIAWNSFGFVANRVDDGSQILPAEPFKVGIAIQQGLGAAYGDFVWLDNNLNGTQDEGEDGVNGVTVDLYQTGSDGVAGTADDIHIGTSITGDNGDGHPGYYLFPELPAGNYFAKFTLPANTHFTPGVGSDLATNSDASTTTGRTPVTHIELGEKDLTWDAGVFRSDASYGNRVWLDGNRNGLQDVGEAGVEGIRVLLYRGNGTVVDSTLTASDGGYLFDNLFPGEYYARFRLPADYIFSPEHVAANDSLDSDADQTTGLTPVTSLDASEQDPTWDTGIYLKPAAIGDRVWIDPDRNGVQDGGELGMAGVVVTLYTAAGAIVSRDTTDANGNYLFSDLTPGSFYVIVAKPDGYAFSPLNQGSNDAVDSDVNTASGRTANYALSPDETDLSVDAGLYRLAALGDFVWNDINHDGIQNPAAEPGVLGVTVRLLDGSGNLIAETTTDDQGYYMFLNLQPATYQVEFALPMEFEFTLQNQGSDVALNSDADVTTGRSQQVTLQTGEERRDIDAGIFKPASVGDRVWLDNNGNGVQDAGETGVSGVTVLLYSGSGDFITSQFTAVNGSYLFDDLIPGSYEIRFQLPNGYIFSPANNGDDTADSDADRTTGSTGAFTLQSGDHIRTMDAGIFQPASVGDLVWHDTNLNGLQDDGEPGLGNIAVTLYNGAGQAVATTTTASDGSYHFVELVAGTYSVGFTLPEGTIFTGQDQGGDDADDSDINPATSRTVPFVLSPGENDLTLDAGMIQLASLGDYVWQDEDNDGIQNADEFGIGGIQVTLFRANGTQAAQTSTDGTGHYHFADLLPGSYYVQFVAPPPVIFSAQDQGTDDAVDSDVSPVNETTGRTAVTDLLPGENDPSWDAGIYIQLASIGSYSWFDINRNGIRENGEAAMPGVSVRLHAANGDVLAEQVTGSDGAFLFRRLAPGGYYISFSAPNGYALTYANQGNDGMANSDADETTRRTILTTLGQGENDLSWGAGFYQLSSLGNYVWHDDNMNGIQDEGEPPVKDVSVGLLNANGATIQTTSTDEDGFYYFPNLPPASYMVHFVLPPHYMFTQQLQGNDNRIDSDANTSTGRSTVIALGLAVHDSTWDAGLIRLASVGDYVWDDMDADAVQDGDEFGIPGARVELLNNDGMVVAFTMTDENGNYLFRDLPPATYTVRVDETTLPRSYVTSTFNNPLTVALSPGENRRDADFGYRSNYGSIGDFVWFDINRNGLQDPGEPGIPNVLLRLEEINTGETAKKLTGADGRYLFRTLLPGEYRVYVDESTLPDGYFLTSSQREFIITLSDQQHYRDADFGYWHEDAGCNKLVLAWYEPWYDDAKADSSLRHWRTDYKGGQADTSLFEFFSSRDPLVWEYDILLAWASGIDGFVVDWFGEKSYENIGINGLLDTADRLWQRYNPQGFNFQIICSYNERAVGRIDSNMVYVADSLMTHPAYWGTREGRRRPLFIFNQREVKILPETYRTVADTTLPKDAFLAWNGVEDEIFVPMDVVYPWVQTLPEKWDDVSGKDWGKPYLDQFYARANSPAASGNLLFSVRSVWPGFDDRSWVLGDRHWMSRRDTLTYRWTWEEAFSYSRALDMPWILIETWNDHNRGSAIQPSLEWDYDFIVKTRDYIRQYKRECRDYDFENLGLLVPQHIHQARIAARLRPDLAPAIEAKVERSLDLFFARRHLDAISLADDAAGIAPKKASVVETPLTGIKITWTAAPNATGYVLYMAKTRARFEPCSFDRPDSIYVGNVSEYTLQRQDRDKLYFAVVPVNAAINPYANGSWFQNTLTGADVISTVCNSCGQENLQPNQLVFISGTPTHSGEGWQKAVDRIMQGWDGTTTAISPEYGNAQKSPWAIFGFADGGLYKFDHLAMQTDNGSDDDSEPGRQTARFQVLVSTTGTEEGDFTAVFSSRVKSGAETWYKLGSTVKARYIKLVLLEPVYTLYRQVVEFQVSNQSKQGAVPASETATLVEIPATFKLEQNYPNPFNAGTKIRYQLPAQVHVTIKVYDLLGREVAVLVDENQAPGVYEAAWRPNELASGLYFYRIVAGSFSQIQRMLFLK